MLVLNRKIGEAMNIGDDVVVKILSISGNQVRLGIRAPQEMPVHRQEIYERLLQEEGYEKTPSFGVSSNC